MRRQAGIANHTLSIAGHVIWFPVSFLAITMLFGCAGATVKIPKDRYGRALGLYRSLDAISTPRNAQAVGIFTELDQENYLPATFKLAEIYGPTSNGRNAEKYTFYITKGAQYPDPTEFSDYPYRATLQYKLGRAYSWGPDQLLGQSISTLPKDSTKACYWYEQAVKDPYITKDKTLAGNIIDEINQQCPELRGKYRYVIF